MTTQPTAKERVALSKELSDFLIEFSIALHRHAMYPDEHPSLRESAAAVVNQLAMLLDARPTISIGVARRQLVIEGVATDPRHPVLSALAERLHGHQIGAVTFGRGVSGQEILSVLRLLAREPEREETPLGLGDPALLTQWQGVRLHPLTYEQLELVGDRAGAEGDGGTQRSAQLWIGLARAAMVMDGGAEESVSTEPSVVAEAINEHEQAQAYDQVIVGYLLQIAEQLRTEGSAGAAALRRRMSRLVSGLEPETLKRLVEMGGDHAQRRKFLLDATAGMSVDAVVELVRAAAESEGQTISNSMVRLLSKLSAAAETGSASSKPLADGELRDQVRALIGDWTLSDPNPGAYTKALDRLARSSDMCAGPGAQSRHPLDAMRMVWMGLESNAEGPAFWRAVDAVIEESGPAPLVRAAAEYGDGTETGAAIWNRLATPAMMKQLLSDANPDLDALDALIDRTPLRGAVDALLDAWTTTGSDVVQAAVRKRLIDAGAVVLPSVVARLERSEPPMLVRLLEMIVEIGVWPAAFSTTPFARHTDGRVRLAALRVALHFPAERERSLCIAITEATGEHLHVAVEALRSGVPDAAVPLIANRLSQSGVPMRERTAMLRALGGVRSSIALSALMRAATAGRTFFGKPRLAPRSDASLAALSTLASTWSGDKRVDAVLKRAARSNDPQVRRAAAGALG